MRPFEMEPGGLLTGTGVAPGRAERMIRAASGGRVLLTGLLLAVGAWLLFTVGPWARLKETVGDVPFPEEGISSAPVLQSFLTALGTSGRDLYLQVQLFDLIIPMLIGLFGLTLVAWMLRLATASPARAWGLLVPLIAPVADVVEDGVIVGAILSFPAPGRASSALPVVTTLKFAGLGLTLFFAMALVAPALLRRRRGHRGRWSAPPE